METEWESRLADAVGETVKFARSGEALLSAMTTQAQVAETLNRIGTELAPDLYPELQAAIRACESVGEALLSAVQVAQTKYEMAVERFTTTPDTGEGDHHAQA